MVGVVGGWCGVGGGVCLHVFCIMDVDCILMLWVIVWENGGGVGCKIDNFIANEFFGVINVV